MEPLVVRVEDTESRTTAEHTFLRSPVRIGRNKRNDLALPQAFVSAWHGRIDFDGESVRYTDLGSTNGTLLNGEIVDARAAVPLAPDAEVTIGSLRLTCATRTTGGARADPRAAARATVNVLASEPVLPPGGITAIMKRLAATPSDDVERAWRHVLLPGTVIGRFELLREIGRGSFGVVFEARDRQLGRLVAFKVVRPGRDSQVMFRQEILQREAEAVAQLSHQNIVSLYDVGTCDSGPYLIMELLRGETLRDRLRRERMPLAEVLEVSIEVAWALDHAHAAGVIHRDLKPANVFLCTGGHVKVLDFGIAHVFGVGTTKAVGTPAYMAPEQWRQGPQDARTDVFGAAAMLARMLTGKFPYRVTESSSTVLEPGAQPRLDDARAPPQLVALLRRALSPSPEGRPKDGHAWLTALLEIHEQLDKAQPVEVAVEPRDGATQPIAARKAERAKPWRSTAVVLAAFAALGAVAALSYLLLS